MPPRSQQSLSRRWFLRILVLGVLVFLLPFGLLRRFLKGPKPKGSFQSLTDLEAAVMLKAYRGLIPEKERERFEGGESAFLKKTDGLMDAQPPWLRKDIGLAMTVVALSPLFQFRFTPFQELPDEEARKTLRKLSENGQTPIRLAEEAVRQVIYFVFYTNRGTWKKIGYEGPWVMRSE